jgi:hypothetical protein
MSRTWKNKKVKIIGLIIVIAVLLVGVFLVGKKLVEKKATSQTKTDKPNQKNELEKTMEHLKSQFRKETNPVKKQELEAEIKKIREKIQNPGGSNNPKNPPPQNPPKTSRQLTVKCNGAVGGKCEYINVANLQERILIDTKNKIFYSDDVLYMKGNQYTISFNEEDVAKKGNNFIFDENNDKLQLAPVSSPTPQTPPPPPNNNSEWINIEVK